MFKNKKQSRLDSAFQSFQHAIRPNSAPKPKRVKRTAAIATIVLAAGATVVSAVVKRQDQQ